ncbi:MAG: YeeE/YedE family protein, partial [Paucibacter sp.]|nr:YeeE/YedE family protein [Roseateles sp.]
EGGAARDLIGLTGMGRSGALLFGALWLLAAIRWAWHQRVPFWGWAGAVMVGLSIAAAWWFTSFVALLGLDAQVAPEQSLSFTGPSAEVLVRVLFSPDKAPTFDLGLVPGVFLGAFAAAALFGELKLEGFSGGASMRRYMVGAVLMGFGGMLAGGCAVGAGLSGAAVFTITSWVTLSAMWAAAALTDYYMDRRPERAANLPAGALDQPVPVLSRSFPR